MQIETVLKSIVFISSVEILIMNNYFNQYLEV